jgi:CubicO group peptidase (beta-lactamase class C family)
MHKLFRRLAIAAACLTVAATAAWLTAVAGLDTSTFARAVLWRDADVGDWRRFPARPVAASSDPYVYEEGPGYPDGLPNNLRLPGGDVDLDALLARSATTAFIVAKDDRLIYEGYFNGSSRQAVQTSFSVAKSFASALVGRAVADGFLGGLDEPITNYLPELRERDRRFAEITIRHLLTMSSGLRYEAAGTPWSDDTTTYYAPDLRKLALTATEVVEPPGERFHYNNFNPLLMGVILERATGMAVADYLARELWQPMGAEAEASWSLDSQRSGFEKMESGINARAIDFLKLGSLYLNDGMFNGNRILPADWVAESTRYDDSADPTTSYQYWWWAFRDAEIGDYFAARGNKGQFIVVFPAKRLVVLRQGEDFGGVDWLATIAALARSL